MEFRQLQHFLAVADEKHFTRAARRMNIVQSGLSASIRALEHELKTELFTRTTRRVELTMAGRVFYEQAQRIVAATNDARDAVAAVQGLNRGKLAIGTVHSLGAFIDLPALLARFHAQHPEIEIQLSQGGPMPLLERIRDGQLDIAFVPVQEPPQGIAATMIACEELVLACPPGHAMAGACDVPLRALQAEVFIDFQPGWGTRPLVDRAFHDAGLERRIAFEVTDLETLLDLVARGLGVALVPEPLALARADGSHPRPIAMAGLAAPEICWELALAFAARERSLTGQRNPAAHAFIEVLMQARGFPDASTEQQIGRTRRAASKA